ncbi:MAG: ABC transporter permease [Candidatus Rokubacteria bacterium]|nr:ABC transporter permease [Candidatus Rokubacteria bacterium]
MTRARAFYFENERFILGSLTVGLVLLLWEGLTRGWWADLVEPALGAAAGRWRIDPVFLSSPTAIARTGARLFATGEIWNDLRVSGLEFLLGFAVAVVTGIALGLVAGWYRHASFALEPFFSALNATPRVALLPLIIIWVGIDIWSKVLVVLLGAIVPIYLNLVAGVRTTDARLLSVARSFGSSEPRLFWTIILPSAVPFLLTGLRLGVGRAMVGIVVGELYAATAGVGFMITVAGATFQTDKVFVGVILIALAGLLMIEGLTRLERRFDTWRPKVGAAA